VVAAAASAGVVEAASGPTFTRDIEPILQRHCQECHRAGGDAPVELAAYEQGYRRRQKIVDAVESRAMPPRKAGVGYGDLAGGRGMWADESATAARWAATGAIEGDPRDRPAPRVFDTAHGRGAPDLVLRTEPFTVPARGGDVYRCFSLAAPADEERYFTVSEI